MTDNEIMKGLECCVSVNGEDCENCPYKNEVYVQGYGGCCNQLSKDALDLINRQRGELRKRRVKIHKLLKELNQVQDYYEIQKAEIDRLNENCNALISANTFLISRIDKAKAEAIKEFEKLVTRRLNCNTPRGAYLLNVMNEVKKELTEVK